MQFLVLFLIINHQFVVMNHLKKYRNYFNPRWLIKQFFEVCDYTETSALSQTEQVAV
jgi:hypothetical protein